MKMLYQSVCTLMLASLFSCTHSPNNQVELVNRNFKDEILTRQNLVFTFNRDLAPDSLADSWDTTQYISFSPRVSGRFKWEYASELMFSPQQGFQPGTVYTATLTSQVLKFTKKHLSLAQTGPLQFHTPFLAVNSARVSWARDPSLANIRNQLDLTFNYPINGQQAARKISLSSQGQNIPFSVYGNENGKTLSLQFSPLNELDQVSPLQVRISRGIQVMGSAYRSGQDTLIQCGIPSRYDLSINNVIAEHTGEEGILTVYTSQPLIPDSLKSQISLVPDIPFDIQLNDQGLVITSKSFNPAVNYQLTISDQVQGYFGGRLKSPFSQQVGFGRLRPSVSFVDSKGIYLSAQGARNIALNIVNVPRVRVTVVKIYANNLEQFFQNGTQYGYGSDVNDENGGSYHYFSTDNIGDTVYQKEYETQDLPRLNAARVLHMDFQDRFTDFPGIYVLTVASTSQYWITDSKILSISDLGLIVRQTEGGVHVFANSIKNTLAEAGVRIRFVGMNNQSLYSTSTDQEGIASFKQVQNGDPGFRVGLVTAQKGSDFNFVLFSQSRVETSRFDVGGARDNDTHLSVLIYSPRNLFRPGETIPFSIILRNEQFQSPGEIPLKIVLRMPDGKIFSSIKKILNSQGSCESSFPTEPSSMTGTYSLEVYTGNDILLNTEPLSLEEFVPDRIKVTLNLDKPLYSPSDSLRASGNAENLFGTPAANLNYQFELNLDQADFHPASLPDYLFSLDKPFQFQTQMISGKTGDAGMVNALFRIPSDARDAGMLNGNLMLTVFDETGRPVHRVQTFQVQTQPIFYGIRQIDQYISTRVPIPIPLIAVDRKGNPLSQVPAQITVIRKDWQTVLEHNDNGYSYVSQEQDIPVFHQQMMISGTQTIFYYTARVSGDYEVRVSRPGSSSYVAEPFWAWGWGDTQFSSFQVNNQGNITIKTDQAIYQVGKPVKVLFTTPFDGKLLVTLERGHLYKYYYLNTVKKSATLTLKAKAEYIPNVYITATLIRPMDHSTLPLVVAHGYQPLLVEDPGGQLPLKLTAALHSRSKTSQVIEVRTRPGAYVTLAAVDEGILQVNDYQTPDPYRFFYQKRALQVRGFDVYPLLLPEVFVRSSTGGDQTAKQLQLRVNPNFVNRVHLLSFWSGIRQADQHGEVLYPISIPQFSGDIRIMALAYDGKAFASADQHMKVSDPVVISTGLPRFLGNGDTVDMPVNLSNTTSTGAKAQVDLSCSGPLRILGSSQGYLNLAKNGEGRLVFRICSTPAIGTGHLQVRVRALGETFTDETDLSVRPSASIQYSTGSGSVLAAKTVHLDLSANFLPLSVRARLIISRSPMIRFAKNLDNLVHYPYGCLEQTVSAAFPQLVYPDLVQNLYGPAQAGQALEQTANENVQRAIDKLQSMQLSDGGLLLWPSGGYESWWGSVYAAHFLLEAQKDGFAVNQGMILRLLDYLKWKIDEKTTAVYHFNQNQSREMTPEETAYSLFVLALAGQPQLSTMDYYKANPELLTLDSKYLIAASFALAGEQEKFREMLPADFSGETPGFSFGGSLYSPLRDEAISLYALLQADPRNPQIGILARHLSESLKNDPYPNTQENSFSFLALGEIAKNAGQTKASAWVSQGNRVLGKTDGNTLNLDLSALYRGPITLKVKGTGSYYYFWQVSGIPSDGRVPQEDNFLKVRRTYLDRSGMVLKGNHFHQNQLIVARISLIGPYNTHVDNVAITDLLPAGLEIENPRIRKVPELKWIRDNTPADYLDYRDDRINLFTSADDTVKNFYYLLRAVSPGTFRLGPVQAEAMYQEEYHSYNGAGWVRISER